MTILLLVCLVAVVISGVLSGRKITLARHEASRGRIIDAATRQLSITLLTVLYGVFAGAGPLWTICMLIGSLAGVLVGHWAIRRVTPEELSDAQLGTDAILER